MEREMLTSALLRIISALKLKVLVYRIFLIKLFSCFISEDTQLYISASVGFSGHVQESGLFLDPSHRVFRASFNAWLFL